MADHRIVPFCSSPSPFGAGKSTYHVFLSFRGEDTRHNIVSQLYKSLEESGIHTFKDDEKFEKGRPISDLLQMIEESTIAIVVLSPNFATSTWCLKELVRILECKDVKKQEVLPIFYNVDPSDLRKNEGSFAEALANLEVRYKDELETIQKWRKALAEVATISGYPNKNRDESLLIGEIVGLVFDKVYKKHSINDEKLVGIDSQLDNLDSLLQVRSSDEVRFVGIWGMAGIGKTTLATAAYRRHWDKFDGHCFISKVKESYQKDGPFPMQQEIILRVLKNRSLNVADRRDEGVDFMWVQLHQKKVLLVLDDVDHLSQLENLARSTWFGPGSRIIITTRSNRPLVEHGKRNCKIHIYKPPPLDRDSSLKLFSWHAFQGPENHDGAYTSALEKVVQYAAGLPLALRVLGSSLYSRSADVWRLELEKLEQIPNSDIHDVLKVSYDGLHDTEKEIFLDIACFFKGEDKDYVRYVLNGCGFYADLGIETLVNKSLISISDNRIYMHDLLQDMGREIVRRQSTKDPGKRSRLWLFSDIRQALGSNKNTEEVEGLFLDLTGEPGLNFEIEKAISRMSNLRLLKIGNLLYAGSFEYLHDREWRNGRTDEDFYKRQALRNLETQLDQAEHVLLPKAASTSDRLEPSLSRNQRCLYWYRFSMESLPPDFDPSNLVELNMCHSNLRQLWTDFKDLASLKFVKLSHSRNLRNIPDLSGAPNLERLILEGCRNLVKVHDSVGSLQSLIFLSLKDCENLMDFPKQIHMISLEVLDLSGCIKLSIFPEITGPMERLTDLHLRGTAIRELPSSIGYLTGLTSLDMTSSRIEHTPGTISKLKSLEFLILSNCLMLQTFPEIEDDMQHLKFVYLDNTAVEELPRSMVRLSQLSFLSLSQCKNLGYIPEDIAELKSLKTIDLTDCSKLKNQQPELSRFECISSTWLDQSLELFSTESIALVVVCAPLVPIIG